MKRSALFLGLVILSAPARAEDDAELWTGASASGSIIGPVMASGEVIARFSDDERGLYQVIAGGLAGYRVHRDVTVWAGYVRAIGYQRGEAPEIEQRLRTQVTADLGHGLALRLRGEQRWFEREADVASRVRVQLRWTRPIAGKIAAFVGHESFVNLDSARWGPRAGYERMRNTVGLGTPLTKSVRLEASYLHQLILARGASDTRDHVANVALAYSF